MADSQKKPWLTIVGLGEDGLATLSDASRFALEQAELVFGSQRHLTLAKIDDRGRTWPIPYSIEPVMEARGTPVVVLASGDPFWHGAGTGLIKGLGDEEWVCYPAPSSFSWAASVLGWALESTICLALHAAPVERLRPVLADQVRILCLMRDGPAVKDLALWLKEHGFGLSKLHVMEALGGRRQRVRDATAATYKLSDVAHPVVVGIEVREQPGQSYPLSQASGLSDDLFVHDGQITKQPVRALTLSALAPKAGERLWDLGAGSGSISVEFLLAAPGTTCVAVEQDPKRAKRIQENAATFGLAHRLRVATLTLPKGLSDLPRPDVVFIGGGASEGLLTALWSELSSGARLVANGVTLEAEALFSRWQAEKGGRLMRFEISEAEPLGGKRAWKASRPIIQWSIVR